MTSEALLSRFRHQFLARVRFWPCHNIRRNKAAYQTLAHDPRAGVDDDHDGLRFQHDLVPPIDKFYHDNLPWLRF